MQSESQQPAYIFHSSYQQVLRDEEGWNDLKERAAQLRARARMQKAATVRSDDIRALFLAGSTGTAIAQLADALSMHPNDQELLRICLEQSSQLLRERQSDQALKLIRIGTGFGQGSLLTELRLLDTIAKAFTAFDRGAYEDQATLVSKLVGQHSIPNNLLADIKQDLRYAQRLLLTQVPQQEELGNQFCTLIRIFTTDEELETERQTLEAKLADAEEAQRNAHQKLNELEAQYQSMKILLRKLIQQNNEEEKKLSDTEQEKNECQRSLNTIIEQINFEQKNIGELTQERSNLQQKTSLLQEKYSVYQKELNILEQRKRDILQRLEEEQGYLNRIEHEKSQLKLSVINDYRILSDGIEERKQTIKALEISYQAKHDNYQMLQSELRNQQVYLKELNKQIRNRQGLLKQYQYLMPLLTSIASFLIIGVGLLAWNMGRDTMVSHILIATVQTVELATQRPRTEVSEGTVGTRTTANQPVVVRTDVVPSISIVPSITTTATSQQDSTLTNVNPNLIGLNASLQINNWQIAFPRAHYALLFRSLPYLKPPQRGQYLIVILHVINTYPNVPSQVPTDWFVIKDAKSRIYHPLSNQQLLEGINNSTDISTQANIAADGNYRRLHLLFDIDTDTSDMMLFTSVKPSEGWKVTPNVPTLAQPQVVSGALSFENWIYEIDSTSIRRLPDSQESSLQGKIMLALQMRLNTSTGGPQDRMLDPYFFVLRDDQGRVYVSLPAEAQRYGQTQQPPVPVMGAEVPADNSVQTQQLVFAIAPDATNLTLFATGRPDQAWQIPMPPAQ